MVWRIGSIGDARDPVTVLEAGDRLVRLDSLLGTEASPRPGELTVRALLDSWDDWRPRLADAASRAAQTVALNPDEVEWLPPVCFPRKLIICGANYRQHVAEMGDDPDAIKLPFTLLKPASTSPIGAGQAIELPEQAEWVDWEGELGVLIGRRTRHVSAQDALGAVAGFLPVNDVSARDWVDQQVPGVGMDWTLHKGFDGFTPAGPLLTPAEFVPNPQDLRIVLTVNGTVKQDASTSEMVFPVAELIAHLSSVMTLEPGDMLLTGSPSGSGFARNPRERLEDGDVVAVSIEGLGELVNPVRRART
jgi:2-keto-4-pentenoate hydratase/2-oxohepta-3-ene-1,7-dioic acid hydratase in catechol pathway